MLYGVFFVGRSQCLEQLLQLRDDVGKELNRKSTELRSQLARLGGEIASSRGRGGSVLRGKKVPPKYRDRAGNTWAGRVQNPDGWLPQLKKGKSWKILQLKRLLPEGSEEKNKLYYPRYPVGRYRINLFPAGLSKDLELISMLCK